MSANGLSHIDAHGHARMVDVTQKAQTLRRAVARCTVTASSNALAIARAAQDNDVFETARVIGIQAAKQTSDLIPLCHPLLIGDVAIDFEVVEGRIEVEARVETFGQTGVEMEALTACALAALSICDTCRSLDPMMALGALRVWEKRGGRSGTWRYQAPAQPGDSPV